MKFNAVAVLLFVFLSGNLAGQRDIRQTDFRKADSVARLYPKHSLKDLKTLVNKLTTPFSTQEEKFRAIYTWVSINIENDFPMFIKNRSMRSKYKDDPVKLKEWNSKLTGIVMKKMENEFKTVCTGYAYLIRKMSALAGINAIIVDGYGRNIIANVAGEGVMNHSWNAVRLNNTWYLCDPTWSSGDYDTKNKEFVPQYDPSYFLAEPELFARNHYPQDTAWMFLKNKPELKTFLNGPIVYRGAFQNNICPMLPEQLNVITTKGTTVSFQFTMQNKLGQDKVALQVEKTVTRHPVTEVSAGVYTIDHTFNGRGIFDVHLMLDDQYIYTYVVKVN